MDYSIRRSSPPFTFLGAVPVDDMGAAYPASHDADVSAFQRQLNRFATFIGFTPVKITGRVDATTRSAIAAVSHYLINVAVNDAAEVFYLAYSCNTYECFYRLIKDQGFTAAMKMVADAYVLPSEIKPKRPGLFAAILGTGGLVVGAVLGVLVGRAKK